MTISNNLLTRLDGNGVFIGGYNRGLTIEQNEFRLLGGSAIRHLSHHIEQQILRDLVASTKTIVKIQSFCR
eukprot:COSAG05_NODE_316_length_11576_cov_16.975342_3_plen_71_part_00